MAALFEFFLVGFGLAVFIIDRQQKVSQEVLVQFHLLQLQYEEINIK